MVHDASAPAPPPPSPDRVRFRAISLGLSFIDRALAAEEALQVGDAAPHPRIASTHRLGVDAVVHLLAAPRGKNGTGRDTEETLSTVRTSLQRLEGAIRASPLRARSMIELELDSILGNMEGVSRDVAALRESLRVEPEYVLQFALARLVVIDGLELLEGLHVPTRTFRERCQRFEEAVRSADPSVDLNDFPAQFDS